MKKILAIVLAAMMLCFCLAGCAGGNGDNSNADGDNADNKKKGFRIGP